MTYQQVADVLQGDNSEYGLLLTEHSGQKIGSMLVQYGETNWQFLKRIAGRLGTVLIPDCQLSRPYVIAGMPKRSVQGELAPVSYEVRKDMVRYWKNSATGSGGFTEADAVSYQVCSRDLYELGDPVSFLGKTLYVYGQCTVLEGGELIHTYTLKDKGGFYTKRFCNQNLIGASLKGTVSSVDEDEVRIKLDGDIKQSKRKWFPYATPFSTPEGAGWYFMPEVGDEIRLVFPTEEEKDAYVESSVHVTHGSRSNPKVKFIRTVYGQEIVFDATTISIDDGAGSTIVISRDSGIEISTGKSIAMRAQNGIDVKAGGTVEISGDQGVTLKQNDSQLTIRENIQLISYNNKMQQG